MEQKGWSPARAGVAACRLGLLVLSMLAASVLSAGARAQEAQEYASSSGKPLSDLTLENFFSEGWTQPWAKRERASGTPDMALLKVTTNFLEREFRFDYARTNGIKHSKTDRTDFINALVAYGLDRRFMLEVISNYQWNNLDDHGSQSGGGGGGLARFQLVDTELSSYSAQVRLSEPNHSIGQNQTSTQYSFAGFNDLNPLLGLYRVGLYYSATYEALVGPHPNGARTSDIAYDISLAKTLTERNTPIFGNFTAFIEGYATTDLSGSKASHTTATVTPGVRFWFYPENSLTVGVDVPVSGPKPYDNVFRATYILNF